MSHGLDKRLLADAVRRTYNTERVFEESVEGFVESVLAEYDRLVEVEEVYDLEALSGKVTDGRRWFDPPAPIRESCEAAQALKEALELLYDAAGVSDDYVRLRGILIEEST